MADLTPQQIEFIEKQLKIPKIFGRKEAKAKKELWSEEFRSFNTHRESIRQRVAGLADAALRSRLLAQLADAEGIVMATPKQPNFDGGHKQLDDVNHVVQSTKVFDDCNAAVKKVLADADRVLASAPGNAGELRLMRDFIADRHAKGSATGDTDMLRGVLAATTRLADALTKALPSAQPQPTGQVQAVQDELKRQETLRGPRELLQAQDARWVLLQAKLSAGFADGLPPALDGQRQAINPALTVAEDASPDDVTLAATTAKGLIDTIENDAQAPLAARARYEAARSRLLAGRYATLTAHKQLTDPIVAKGHAKVNGLLQQAQSASTGFDDAGALGLVEQALGATNDTIERADELAEFLDVRDDREERMKELKPIDAAKVGDREAKTALSEARTTWRSIEDAFASGNHDRIKGTAPDLEKLPAMVETALRLVRLSDEFDTDYKDYVQRLENSENAIATWGQPAQGEMLAFSNPVRQHLAALAPDLMPETNRLDLRARSAGLVSANVSLKLLVGRTNEVGAYHDALDAFRLRRDEVETHAAEAGYAALTAYRTRIAEDRQHAEARRLQGEYTMGERVLNSAEPLHAPALQLLADANAYFAERKLADDELAAVGLLPGAAAAADSLQAVRGLLGEADTARGVPDWKFALALASAAKQRLADARSQADNDDIISGMQDRSAVNALDADLVAALAAFDSGYQAAENAGAGTGDLAPKLQNAKTLRDQAEQYASIDPKNIAQARIDLNAACDATQEALKLMLASESYATQLQTVKALRQALIDESLNPAGYYDQELAQIQQFIDDAELAAAAPGLNYPGAEARLTLARPVVQTVRAGAPQVIELDLKVEDVKQAVAGLDTDGYRAHIATGLARLKLLQTEAGTARGNNDPALGLAKAKEALDMVAGLKQIAARGLGYAQAITGQLDPAIASLPATRTYSAEERQLIEDKRHAMQKAAAAGAFFAAQDLVTEIVNACSVCRSLETNGAEYDKALKPVDDAVQSLQPRIPGEAEHLQAELDGLVATLDAAKAAAALKNHNGARERLKPLPAALDTLGKAVDAHQAYLDARKASGDKLAEIGKLPNKTAVEPLVARLRAEHATAAKLGETGQTADARAMFEGVLRQATQVLKDGASFAEYSELAEQAKTLPEDSAGGLQTALRRAQAFVDGLRDDPEAMAVMMPVMQAQSRLTEAGKLASTDERGAKDRLEQAMTLCTQARLALSQYHQLREFERGAREPVVTLLATHTQAGFVRDALQAQLERLDDTMNKVRKDAAHRVAAQKVIEAVMVEFHKQRAIADAQVKVAELIEAITPELLTMERHDQRYAVTKDIAAVRFDLENGRAQAEQRSMAEALKLLQRSRERARETLLSLTMQAGTAPSPAELKALLAQSDGPERLDKLVENLDPGVRHKVMNEVFQARFGCQLALYKDAKFVENGMEQFKQDNPAATPEQIEQKKQELEILNRSRNFDMQEAEKAPDLRRMYQLMSKLPKSMTLDNDSLKIFTQKKGRADGSYFNSDKKEVCMSEGPPQTGGYYGVGLPHELDDIDPNAKVVAGEVMTYFEWNTLHEVGHAVDDKLGFMKNRGNALGGWVEHGSNVRPVAKALKDLYDFDLDYLAAYLDGVGKPPMPVPTGGASAEEWERRRADACAHADRMRVGLDPWQTAASAKACAIGTQCFQESYAGSWTEYPLAQRKMGVSGYQFRSPAEWFSELFACYHSGKMNPSHPAVSWLSTL
ncbi:MAG TPA: hypothetical protein VLA16_04100 [Ideonella sp.]|nr:hypothetical protein [Ideonella sp.]